MTDQCAPVWLWAVRYMTGAVAGRCLAGTYAQEPRIPSPPFQFSYIDSAAGSQRGRSYVCVSAQSGRAGGNKFGRAKGCRAAWILPVGVSEEVVERGGRGTAAADVLTGPTSSQACGVGEQAGSRIMCSEAGQDEIDGVAADRMGRRAR